MTDAQALLELAQRCEAADGPDRELDAAVHHALYLHHAEFGEPISERELENCPRYTASLDAAMTLVPEGWRFSVDNAFGNGGAVCGAIVNNTVFAKNAKTGDAATPALALVAAALRSRAAEISS